MHDRVHNKDFNENRGDIYITRGMNIASRRLGVSGQCDVLEFHRAECGVCLAGKEGLWKPFPIEYKRGSPKLSDCDALQLCAQAMCLEEMLCCDIIDGAIFYGEVRRRQAVVFTPELREKVEKYALEMHNLFQRGHTPKVKPSKSCNACSMKELCLPKLMHTRSVGSYIQDNLG